MARAIVINDCGTCPHRDHRGAFGDVSYVPCCRKANRNLPYTVHESRMGATASQTDGIPAWCPLPKYEPKEG